MQAVRRSLHHNNVYSHTLHSTEYSWNWFKFAPIWRWVSAFWLCSWKTLTRGYRAMHVLTDIYCRNIPHIIYKNYQSTKRTPWPYNPKTASLLFIRICLLRILPIAPSDLHFYYLCIVLSLWFVYASVLQKSPSVFIFFTLMHMLYIVIYAHL